MLYLDASAIAKLVSTERWSEALERRLAGIPLVTSTLSRTEVARTVRRSGSDRRGLADLWDTMALVEVDRSLLDRAGALDPPELRTLDAIHIATALMFGAELEAFITYDRAQARAAALAGLAVESPM